MLAIDHRIEIAQASSTLRVPSASWSLRSAKSQRAELAQLRALRAMQVAVLTAYGTALRNWYSTPSVRQSYASQPHSDATVLQAPVLRGDVLHCEWGVHVLDACVEDASLTRANRVDPAAGAPTAPSIAAASTVVFASESSVPADLAQDTLPEQLRDVLHRYHGRRLDSSGGTHGVEAIQATLDAYVSCSPKRPATVVSRLLFALVVIKSGL